MPDLLLELFSEEIPARMQRKAAEDLRKLVTDALVEAGLVYEGAKAFATPRRLALTVHGVPARSPDRREERKGPRVGAPDKAIEGFLKAAGLASIDQAKVQQDKKGDFYVAVVERPGRPAPEVIAEIVPKVVRAFPWPKSMRWGAASVKPGSLAWVRPLHSILCVFGPETEETEVVDFDIDGIRSGNVTHGHRFMAPAPITVRRFEDYVARLEKAKVVLDADRRKDIILHDARNAAHALGLELVEDEALLEEVAGLVEWPVVLVGAFEEAFLDIPPEVIRTTIRANQKCFVLRTPLPGGERSTPSVSEAAGEGTRTSPAKMELPHPDRPAGAARSDLSPPGRGEAAPRLANRFVMVANLEASDGGKAIVAGNGRVIRARLSDARHFWETDLRPLPDLDALRDAAARFGLDLAKPLDQRMAKLAATNVVFHEKLGAQGERVERIARLAGEIADVLSARPGFFHGKSLSPDDLKAEQEAFRGKVERASRLAKADLTTEMVGEFPELQGLMGRYYATAQGEDASVAAAIEDHYKPVGPSDRVPTDPVAICVALADKLDLLVGFWWSREISTGSKDPFALRRAALGIIRIVLERTLRLHLTSLFESAMWNAIHDWDNHYNSVLLVSDPFTAPDETGDGRRYEVRNFVHVRSPSSLAEVALRDDYTSIAFAEGDWEGVDGHEFIETFKNARLGFADPAVTSSYLLAFFADRLKVQLREQGARHDLVDAVFALGQGAGASPLPGGERSTPSVSEAAGEGAGTSPETAEPPHPDRPAGAARSDLSPPGRGERAPSAPRSETNGAASGRGEGGVPQDDLLLIVRRVEALGKFLDSEDGRNLLAGTKRATNILREEEKKGERYDGAVDPRALVEPEEKALFEAVGAATGEARAAVELEDFDDAMRALAKLRPAVDAFFDTVLVNAPEPELRANRLRLLDKIRAATLTVADFSKVEG